MNIVPGEHLFLCLFHVSFFINADQNPQLARCLYQFVCSRRDYNSKSYNFGCKDTIFFLYRSKTCMNRVLLCRKKQIWGLKCLPVLVSITSGSSPLFYPKGINVDFILYKLYRTECRSVYLYIIYIARFELCSTFYKLYRAV